MMYLGKLVLQISQWKTFKLYAVTLFFLLIIIRNSSHCLKQSMCTNAQLPLQKQGFTILLSSTYSEFRHILHDPSWFIVCSWASLYHWKLGQSLSLTMLTLYISLPNLKNLKIDVVNEVKPWHIQNLIANNPQLENIKITSHCPFFLYCLDVKMVNFKFVLRASPRLRKAWLSQEFTN